MPLVELHFLKKITDNNQELIKEFLTDFLQEKEEFEKSLAQAIHCHHLQGLKRANHKFKSCLRIIQNEELKNYLDSLDHFIESGNWESIKILSEKIFTNLQHTHEELEIVLNQPSI